MLLWFLAGKCCKMRLFGAFQNIVMRRAAWILSNWDILNTFFIVNGLNQALWCKSWEVAFVSKNPICHSKIWRAVTSILMLKTKKGTKFIWDFFTYLWAVLCTKKFVVDLGMITIVTLRFVVLEVSEIQTRTTSCPQSSSHRNH